MRALCGAPQRLLLTAFAVAMLCLAMVMPLLSQQPASAQATLTVTTSENSGPGSLREAVSSASDGDTITFAGGLTTINLTEEIIINTSLAIEGPGQDALTISGGNVTRAFYVGTDAGTDVSISGVTISGGNAVNGGAIYLHTATLSISDSTISGNAATLFNGNASGGGLVNAFGKLTITSSTISDNTAASVQASSTGGGIHNVEGTVTIINSTIADNSSERGDGGGIDNDLGIVTIINSTIADNATVNGHGGGINNDRGTVTIINSTISGNQTTPTFATGGGIYNGGGILDITSSTISGNSSGDAGGGIWGINLSGFTSEITITSSTITDNTADWGAGINIFGGSVEIENSIIAGNLTSEDCAISSGAPASLGYNIDSDNTCGFTTDTDLPDTDPQLGSLADNGGPTWTHTIDENSPAYNAGGAAPCATNTDQRGAPRPQEGACDIGAFEVGILATDPVLTVPEDTTVYATSPDGAAVEFEATAVDWNNDPIEVTCEPESGSTFEVGTTPVECSAIDSLYQTVSDTFTITVLGPENLLSQLIQDVRSGDMPAYLKPRLLAYLNAADLALDRENTTAACVALQQFSQQVDALSPRYIAPGLANQLGTNAQDIRQVLGC